MPGSAAAVNVCAVVLDYRGAELTGRCVESLAGQVAHVAVVDNSADPGHSRRLQQRLDRIPQPPVTLLRPTSNLGFAAGVNHALRHRRDRHDAFLVLNNDACLRPGTVERLDEALRRGGGRAAVAPEGTEDGAPLRRWYQPALALVTQRPLWGSFPWLSGACLLVPRELATPQLFDEDFFMYGEDVELAARLHRRGLPLVTVAGLRIAHLGSAAEPPGGYFYEYHTARGHLQLARKLAHGVAQRRAFLAARVLTLGARACARSLRQRSLTPWRALIAAWRTPGAQPAIPE